MTEAYRIEEATSRREQAEADLYRPDGSRYYSDEEHAERVRAIQARHRADFDRIEAEIARKVEEAEERLLLAENADLASTLTTEELQRVSVLSGFVADDVERLSLGEVVKRCRAALATADRPTLFALAHHVARRAGEEEDLGLVEEFGEVAQLRAKLAPDQERKLAAARQAHEEAQELRERAYLGRRGAKDAFDLYAQSGYWTAS
jgi:hypothetical protein